MQTDRRSGDDRRQSLRRREDREKSYEVLAYELDCKNETLEDLSNEISDITRKITNG